MTFTATKQPLARMICIAEEWGIYCGAVALADTADLPAKSAHKIRMLIKNSQWRSFHVDSLDDLAARAKKFGIEQLPISVYTPSPGKHKSSHWNHLILSTSKL